MKLGVSKYRNKILGLCKECVIDKPVILDYRERFSFGWLAVFGGGECLFHFPESSIALLSWQNFWGGNCALNEVGR